ncbi:MAG: putative sugar transporter, permease component, partial [Microbacteriaceae bacterium]|nr:putative sugar transporter, permease component [Microbacteriaceae bacterium]
MRRGVIARESRVTKVAAMTVMVVLAIYFLLPIYFLVVAATKPQGDLASTFGLAFSHFNLWSNLGTLFSLQNGIFLQWALNSLIYAAGGAAVGTLVSTLAGYALAKFQFRGRETLFSVVLGGVLVPTTALALPLFL